MGGDTFMIANDKEVLVTKISDTNGFGETSEGVVDHSQICHYVPKGMCHKIHMIYPNIFSHTGQCMILIEFGDGQLDLNRFKPTKIDPTDFKYDMVEITDYAPWKVSDDHIKKLKVIKTGKYAYFIALRESGGLDIYANMDRQVSVQESGVKDIDFDDSNLYFLKEDGQILRIPLSLKLEVSWSQAKPVEEGFQWEHIRLCQLDNYLKPFHSFQFIGENIYVAHGHFISQFNIVHSKFLAHFNFGQDDVRLSFKFKQDPRSTELFCYVLTNRGNIFKVDCV
jgi:hypothetical protein